MTMSSPTSRCQPYAGSAADRRGHSASTAAARSLTAVGSKFRPELADGFVDDSRGPTTHPKTVGALPDPDDTTVLPGSDVLADSVSQQLNAGGSTDGVTWVEGTLTTDRTTRRSASSWTERRTGGMRVVGTGRHAARNDRNYPPMSERQRRTGAVKPKWPARSAACNAACTSTAP